MSIISNKVLINYTNGDTEVSIYEDGTKVRKVFKEHPKVFFPETIDVKITNYCDLGCPMCFESSTTKGKHGNLENLLEILKDLPSGVELAFGGGNPLSHPNLLEFLKSCKEKGWICNLTVNQGHLKTYFDLIKELIDSNLIYGLGISITSNNYKYIKEFLKLSDNIVFHIIAGYNQVEIIEDLINVCKESLKECKVLVLGYKQFGFGLDYYSEAVEKNLKRWYMYLFKFVKKCILSFDNLAIEQLNIKRYFTSKGWNSFYMGDDGSFSMYIDSVEEKYAKTSRSYERKSFKEISLKEYFKNLNL